MPWLAPCQFLRRAVVADFPNDIRPSAFCRALTHGAVVFELFVPFWLMFGPYWWPIPVAMFLFHVHIFLNFPAAVPLEWNVTVVYGLRYLYVHHRAVPLSDCMASVPLFAFVLVVALIVPLVGNIAPRLVSFLFGMRYYAGNWSFSVWVLKNGMRDLRRLETAVNGHLPLDIARQLRRFGVDESTCLPLAQLGVTFSVIHLNLRWAQLVMPRYFTPAQLRDAQFLFGEMVSGGILGWNFGDGHLQDECMFRAVQELMSFKEGECLVFHGEGQPLFGNTHHYKVVDVARGPASLEEGEVPVERLLELQPWQQWGPTTWLPTSAKAAAKAKDL